MHFVIFLIFCLGLEINYNLGKCYMKEDQPKSASKWFERVLEINPSFDAARIDLLNCYRTVHDME